MNIQTQIPRRLVIQPFLKPIRRGCNFDYPIDIGINAAVQTVQKPCSKAGTVHIPRLCIPTPLSSQEIHQINQTVFQNIDAKLKAAQTNEAKDKIIAVLKTALQIAFLAAAILAFCFGSPIVAPVVGFLGLMTFGVLHAVYRQAYENELGRTAFTEVGIGVKNGDVEFNPNSPSHQRIGNFTPSFSDFVSALFFPALHQAYTRVARLTRWHAVFLTQQALNELQMQPKDPPKSQMV